MTEPSAGTGQIVLGVFFIVIWVLVHIVLYYVFITSGVIADLLLYFLRTFMFPGSSLHGGGPELFGWGGPLQAGLILAGAAGIPAGLAIFWLRRRRVLIRTFIAAFIAGIVVEIYAVYMLFANAFAGVG